MKKILSLIVAAMFLCVCALAEDTNAPWAGWSEISAEEVVTVRLPEEGGAWSFSIDQEEKLELITMEDAEGEWVASFRTLGVAGQVVMTVRFTPDGEEQVTRMCRLIVDISEGGKVERVSESWLMADWFSLDEEECTLTAVLPANATTGYAWSAIVSDPAILGVTGEEYVPDTASGEMTGAGGEWRAEFSGTFEKAGEVTVVFHYSRPWEDGDAQTRELRLFVSENNQISVIGWQTADETDQ